MSIELKQNCKYAMLVPTSMGIRITPENGQPVYASDKFTMYATSAETNVASISSYLGLPVKVLTTFVKGSPIAQFLKSNPVVNFGELFRFDVRDCIASILQPTQLKR